jgi:hypothetical protein
VEKTLFALVAAGKFIFIYSSKFFIPIKGPEGHTDNTATYTFIIKTHSIEQFNQNEITLQDCSIIIYIYFFFIIIIIPALIFISHARVLLDNFY